MNQYELIARVAKYTAIVSSIYLISKFGLNISFDER